MCQKDKINYKLEVHASASKRKPNFRLKQMIDKVSHKTSPELGYCWHQFSYKMMPPGTWLAFHSTGGFCPQACHLRVRRAASAAPGVPQLKPIKRGSRQGIVFPLVPLSYFSKKDPLPRSAALPSCLWELGRVSTVNKLLVEGTKLQEHFNFSCFAF